MGTEVGEWLQDIRGKTPHARFVANYLFNALPHDLFRVVDGLGPSSSTASSPSTCTNAPGVTTASYGASPPSPTGPSCGTCCALSNSRLTSRPWRRYAWGQSASPGPLPRLSFGLPFSGEKRGPRGVRSSAPDALSFPSTCSTVMRSLTGRHHRAVVGRARGGTRWCRPLG